jgi:DNA replication factor GINS
MDAAHDNKLSELQRQLFQEEITNLRFMLENLLKLRIEKMLALMSESKTVDYDLLTRQERRFADHITRNLRNVLGLIEDLFAPPEGKDAPRFILIRFLEDHPQLVGIDLRTYGPFKADDLAVLPMENARVIIRRNGAEPVTVGASPSESP